MNHLYILAEVYRGSLIVPTVDPLDRACGFSFAVFTEDGDYLINPPNCPFFPTPKRAIAAGKHWLNLVEAELENAA